MANFGERIYKLRNRNNMSQGDLADKLDVSRQTVSKWENNMCMPEAEKLLQLSEIFRVSIDYILKGKTIVEPEPVYVYVKDPDSENVSKHNERIVRKYVGIIIAIIGGLLSAWLALFGGWLYIIFTGGLMLLGILFACNAKHPWLIFSWIVYIPTVIAMPFFSMFNPLAIFDLSLYSNPSHWPVVIYAYAVWIILALLVTFTIKAIKKDKTE